MPLFKLTKVYQNKEKIFVIRHFYGISHLTLNVIVPTK